MLSVAHSPCPNDTFIFHALAGDPEFEIRLHDIAELNRLARTGTYDVTKLSVPAFFRVRDDYELLDAGAALGFGCGPLLVAPRPSVPLRRVAVPGELTTADLLLSLWAAEQPERVMVRYDAIFDCVTRGDADAGVVIHESRFVFARHGLVPIVDLGAWWEKTTGLPVPLAVIAVRRSLGSATIDAVQRALRGSVEAARRDPTAPMDYVRRHAREHSDEILRRHIETFVTDFSVSLGETGRGAIARLESMAREKGLIA